MSAAAQDPQPGDAGGERNTFSRRRLLQAGGAALATGLASPLLAACGTPSSSSQSGGKTKLKLMSWEMFEPGEKAAWTQITDDFMAAHKNIEVTWTGWPFSTYDQNVIAQAQAGSVDADVVQCPPELASTLINVYNLCQPIGQIAQAAGLTPDPSHDQYKKNGKLYALGIIVVAFALEYNKQILDAAGISAPPSTLADWLSVTQKISQPPTQFGNFMLNTTAAGADWWNQLQNWPLAYDGAWARGKNLTINSKQNVQSMQFWLNLLKASGVAGSSEDALTKLWQDGQVGMFFNVMLGSATLQASAPKLFPHLATAPPPWPSRKAISRLHPVVVLKSSKNQDAAMELVKWMVEPKNLWSVIQKNGYPVAPYTNFGDKIGEYDSYEASLPWATGFHQTKFVGEYDLLGDYVATYAQIGNIICSHIENAVSGSQTVQQALDAAQQEAQNSLHIHA